MVEVMGAILDGSLYRVNCEDKLCISGILRRIKMAYK